jgi:hypothetical protein
MGQRTSEEDLRKKMVSRFIMLLLTCCSRPNWDQPLLFFFDREPLYFVLGLNRKYLDTNTIINLIC